MKKLLTALAVVSLSACTTANHQGIANMGLTSPTIVASPLEVDIIPGNEVTATMECSSNLFGLLSNEPKDLMFGPEFVEDAGNFASAACTKGALYKAVKTSGADILLMPRYTVEGQTFGCLPMGGCLINKSKVTVKGIAGKYAGIKKMNAETSEKVKAKVAGETKKAGLAGGFLPF